MTDESAPTLETLAGWLESLADDVRVVTSALADEGTPGAAKKALAGGLNYLLKSLDLIDDGIEGLGFLDDAFVLRLCAENAARGAALSDDALKLAGEAGLVRDFLGDLAGEFSTFVEGLESLTVRGRSAESIARDVATREELLGEVSGWVSRYEAPPFRRDEKSLTTLRAFLRAKLHSPRR